MVKRPSISALKLIFNFIYSFSSTEIQSQIGKMQASHNTKGLKGLLELSVLAQSILYIKK